MSVDFFNKIPSFKNFSEIGREAHYVSAPDDWLAIVTDVTGSTKAVQDGHYRKVNIAGASAIAAIRNLCKGLEIPYSFGGDGCALLIPPQFGEKAKEELKRVKVLCQSSFNLGLRVGIVSVSEIRRKGKEVLVAKYQVSDGISLAAFSGGGIRLAEDMLKDGSCEILSEEVKGDPDMEGLSCRWEPLVPNKGKMLALLVLAKGENIDIYREIVAQINKLSPTPAPVNSKNLKFKWPPEGNAIEANLKKGFYILNLIRVYIFTALVYWITKKKKPVGDFNPEQYHQDVIKNADYQKFDDMLRMVVDCSPAEIVAIRNYLEGLRKKGAIYYGLHEADTALMTCLVSSLKSDGHVHFIDAADGGYAYAARELKAQMAS